MKKFNFICLSILYSICSFAQQQSIPVPKPHQLKWHEAEMGAVFHYDLQVFEISAILTCDGSILAPAPIEETTGIFL